MRRLALLLTMAACNGSSSPRVPDGSPAAVAIGHSSSIAVSPDGATVYVVNADADSVSVIDARARTLTAEILLAGAHPAVDPVSGAYTPAVMPRALALSPDARTLYVTGERAGALFAIDLAMAAPPSIRQVAVGSEPIGVVVSADGASVYVACAQDATVVRVATAGLAVTGGATVGGEPWALGWAPDGTLLATLFTGPGVVAIDPATMTAAPPWLVPDTAPRGDPRLAHGQVRGLYDVAARPGDAADELWVAHALLGTDTPQPALDFESTVFPALSIVSGSGAYQRTLSTDAQDVPGIDGAFGDVVSGPHALAFTPDGARALVVDSNSEDVLVVDAASGIESQLVRPLPGHLPEGIAIAPDGMTAYVDERNTADVAVLALGPTVVVDGAPIARLASDPMPVELRLGQHLFFSSNSDEYPITQNHWVACASCHMEGRSDAVTWKFAQGPRDTPSNAGGMRDTGFLFRTADRTGVADYWLTINTEQGGKFDPTAQAPLLAALTAFVDDALPLPVPPTTDPTLVARGAVLFARPDVGCASCHTGPRFTDSGAGNPGLDLAGPVVLHDVGTCVTTGFPDVAHAAVDGTPRAACMFDTPALSGIASTPPYLHDGSAPTLRAVLDQTRGTMGDITSLSSADEDALVEYLRSL